MPSPSAKRRFFRRPLRAPVPTSFQSRLTYAFVGVVALTLALVSPVVINRFDDYFREQETQNLVVRRIAAAAIILSFVDSATQRQVPVILPQADGTWAMNPSVARALEQEILPVVANNVAQADLRIEIGSLGPGVDGKPDSAVVPAAGGHFEVANVAPPASGQARDPTIDIGSRDFPVEAGRMPDWGIRVELSQPYTRRASTVGAMTGLLMVIAIIAFGIAVIVAAILSRRFTSPLRRLTDASRRIAEGDLASRVSPEAVGAGTLELSELAAQFNTMADRLEESVAIIRRDRDRSRDFLADVSHELRTPIAALRTFTELLQGGAGAKPETRAEFLEASAVQLERLDWLAQNLLELSKLDSGLVLLDLRPDDVRATVESAVEQAEPTASKRGVRLELQLPDAPLRIRHDPPRVGQIVTNLVGNALKFTERGGRVRVVVRPEADGAARLEVSDTGVGIDAAELPRIFERFYRGSRMHEARSTGSGLGLAIVKSIVDMHGGTIAVESQVGKGSTFVVTLPRDPREAIEAVPGPTTAPAGGSEGPALPVGPGATDPTAAAPAHSAWARPVEEAQIPKMVDSSPSDAPGLNP
jgi:signal transduction histidine kinase